MCIGRPKKLRFFFVSYHIVLCYVSHHTEDIPGKTYNNKSMRQDLSGPFNLSCSLRRKKKKTLSWWDQSRQRPLGAVGGASDLDFSFPSEHSINIKLFLVDIFFFIVYLMHPLPFCGVTRTESLHPHVWAQKVHFPHKPSRTQQCICACYC